MIKDITFSGKQWFSLADAKEEDSFCLINAFVNCAPTSYFDNLFTKAYNLKIPTIAVGVINISNSCPVDYKTPDNDEQCKLIKKMFLKPNITAVALAFFEFDSKNPPETPSNAQNKIKFFTEYVEKNIPKPRFTITSHANMINYKGKDSNYDLALSGHSLIIGCDDPEYRAMEKPPIPGSDYGAKAVFYHYGAQVFTKWRDVDLNNLLKITGTPFAIHGSVVTPPIPPVDDPVNPQTPDEPSSSSSFIEDVHAIRIAVETLVTIAQKHLK